MENQTGVKYKSSITRAVFYGIVGAIIGFFIGAILAGVIITQVLKIDFKPLYFVVIFLSVFLSSFFFVKLALGIKDGIQIVDPSKLVPLNNQERWLAIITSFVLPIISGFYLYYHWHKTYPLKAKQSLRIFYIVQFIVLPILLIIFSSR